MTSITKQQGNDFKDQKANSNSAVSYPYSQHISIEYWNKCDPERKNSSFQGTNEDNNDGNSKKAIFKNNSPVKPLQYKIIPHYTFPDPEHFKYNLRLSHRNRLQPITVEDNMEIGLEESSESLKNGDEINNDSNPHNDSITKNTVPKIQSISSRKDSIVQKVKTCLSEITVR